jgi:hypothetical protein
MAKEQMDLRRPGAKARDGGDGRNRRLCLDDHKFLGCVAIILEAERRIAERAAARSAAGSPTTAV